VKANIERGKLITPKSLGHALQRKKQLEYEVMRIASQLADKTRTDTTWRGSAERAHKLFSLELRLLSEWIEVRQDDSERLLREAYEVLKVLEDQTDFDPHETRLMEKLDEYFDRKDTPNIEASMPS
jgi:hypothetical protein